MPSHSFKLAAHVILSYDVTTFSRLISNSFEILLGALCRTQWWRNRHLHTGSRIVFVERVHVAQEYREILLCGDRQKQCSLQRRHRLSANLTFLAQEKYSNSASIVKQGESENVVLKLVVEKEKGRGFLSVLFEVIAHP